MIFTPNYYMLLAEVQHSDRLLFIHEFMSRPCLLRLCSYLLFYVFLLSLLTRITSALMLYDKRTLLDIGQRYTNLLQDTNPTWPLEILRNTEENIPGYVCNHGSPRERDAASRHFGECHQRCPALNHMCNQSKLTARHQVRVTS